MVRRRWKSSIADAKTFPGADCETDHILLVPKLRVKLARNKWQPRSTKVNVKALEDPVTKSTFRNMSELKFEDKLKNLDQVEEKGSPETLWSAYKTVLAVTAVETLGKATRHPKKPWISNEVLQLAEEKSKLRRERCSPNKERRYKELRSEIQRRVRRDKEAWLEDKCHQITDFNAVGKSKEMYATIRSVKNTSRVIQQACIKSKNGEVLVQRSDILERWREYGAELFERPKGEPPLTEESILSEEQEPPPLLSEIEQAINQLRAGKSPGIDGIPAELVKATGPNGIKMLHKLCKSIWATCHWLDEWKVQEFVVLFKSGDRKQCSNYRTIALISHTDPSSLPKR